MKKPTVIQKNLATAIGKLKKGDLVVIKWVDHSDLSSAEWKAIKDVELLEPVKVLNVGWIATIKDDFITIYSSFTNSEAASGEFCILKSNILELEKLNCKLTLTD